MPPKQKKSGKSEEKAKQKVIEDKTFGLKNKNKSSKVSKYIKQVETQVKHGGKSKRAGDGDDAKALLAQRKREAAEKKAELEALFKPIVQQQKVPPGVDPKTVVCSFFKAGQCAKGDKCKFAHDLTIERKAAKINLYEDRRDDDDGSGASKTAEERDSMQGWDQSKLEQVVQRRHGKGVQTTTDIVCKHFLEAIDKQTYGWFWDCPNGGDKCKYRHALPPGFVLKSQKKADAAKEAAEEEISLEEFLESERYKIKKVTPVTPASFLAWKQKRKEQAANEAQLKRAEKDAQAKAGKMLHASGRDLFTYNPELFQDDEEALDFDASQRDDLDEEAFADLENLDINDDCEGGNDK